MQALGHGRCGKFRIVNTACARARGARPQIGAPGLGTTPSGSSWCGVCMLHVLDYAREQFVVLAMFVILILYSLK